MVINKPRPPYYWEFLFDVFACKCVWSLRKLALESAKENAHRMRDDKLANRYILDLSEHRYGPTVNNSTCRHFRLLGEYILSAFYDKADVGIHRAEEANERMLALWGSALKRKHFPERYLIMRHGKLADFLWLYETEGFVTSEFASEVLVQSKHSFRLGIDATCKIVGDPPLSELEGY